MDGGRERDGEDGERGRGWDVRKGGRKMTEEKDRRRVSMRGKKCEGYECERRKRETKGGGSEERDDEDEEEEDEGSE